MTPLLALALTFVVAAAVTRWLAAGRWIEALDHPNERSLHAVPTPRTGGLAIVAALALGNTVAAFAADVAPLPLAAVAAAALVVTVSLIDDLRGLSPAVRMVVHVAAAALLAGQGFVVAQVDLPGWQVALPLVAALPLTVLGIVWMTNLYNFMDGMDGFAGGMGVIGFTALALLAARAGGGEMALGCALVAAACAGFLLLNFPPARIFMGDTGSSLLGFLAVAYALLAHREGLFPIWMSLLVFSPFVVDATVTLIRRLLRGERVWRAHRSHFYQRLVTLGWSHRRTALCEYAVMAGCAASAVAVQNAGAAAQWWALWGWSAIYGILAAVITRVERRRALDEAVPPA